MRTSLLFLFGGRFLFGVSNMYNTHSRAVSLLAICGSMQSCGTNLGTLTAVVPAV